MQHDQLDVLPTQVNNHVRVVVKFQRRFGVRHGFHQRHIRLEHLLQHVLGIAGGRDAEHFQFRILGLDLSAQVLEHVDRVLDGVPVRELVRLAENVPFFVEQNCLGRS